MLEEDSFLILEGLGRYRIMISRIKKDPLPHVDGFLANLDTRRQQVEETLEKRRTEKQLLESELAAQNYADEILRLTKKLESIDKELGVNTVE